MTELNVKKLAFAFARRKLDRHGFFGLRKAIERCMPIFEQAGIILKMPKLNPRRKYLFYGCDVAYVDGQFGVCFYLKWTKLMPIVITDIDEAKFSAYILSHGGDLNILPHDGYMFVYCTDFPQYCGFCGMPTVRSEGALCRSCFVRYTRPGCWQLKKENGYFFVRL